MNLRRLGQHLEDLRDLRSKLHFLITEVETEMRRQRAVEAATAPVKAFEDHWTSMGKTVAEQRATSPLPMKYTVWGDPNKNTGIGKLVPYVDYFGLAQAPLALDADAIMSALKKTGWKDVPQLIVPMKTVATGRYSANSPKADVCKVIAGGIEPVAQADGHVEPVNDSPYDSVGDATAYADYRTAVYNRGPYYMYDAWKRQGRPRG